MHNITDATRIHHLAEQGPGHEQERSQAVQFG